MSDPQTVQGTGDSETGLIPRRLRPDVRRNYPSHLRHLVVHARSETDYTRAECGSPRARLFRGDITCKFCLARRGLYYRLDLDYFA